MNATITYEMSFEPHPFNDKRRSEGTKAWVLFEVTTPESGPRKREPVAIFNLDSDAKRFQAHVFATGLDGKLVTIDRDLREMLTLQQKRVGNK